MQRKPITLIVLLSALAGSLTAQSSSHSSSVVPEEETVPFFVFGNLLLVRAQADDQEGYFILDTGAPELILNKKYFQAGISSHLHQRTAVGINGEVQGVAHREVNLQLGKMTWKHLYASLYDLHDMEEAKGIRIVGLLGSLLFRELELTINFEDSELVLTYLDDYGEKHNSQQASRPPDVTVPFRLKGHMPFIEAYVGGSVLKLGIDSGAGIGLIINEKQSMLESYTEPGDSIRLRGLDRRVLLAPTVLLKGLTITNLSYSNLRMAIANLSYINGQFAGMKLDGILGLDLISQHRIAINFRKKEIYIWLPEGDHPQFVLHKPGNHGNIRN